MSYDPYRLAGEGTHARVIGSQVVVDVDIRGAGYTRDVLAANMRRIRQKVETYARDLLDVVADAPVQVDMVEDVRRLHADRIVMIRFRNTHHHHTTGKTP